MNSRMMPAPGIYRIKKITADEFARAVWEAAGNETLESYIGYEQTALMVSRMSGTKVAVNRSPTAIEDGDVMLIASLNYRPDAPTKGAPVNEEDFEFFLAEFWKE